VPKPGLVYTHAYFAEIGLHVFPTRKYQLVHARLVEDGVIAQPDVIEPNAAAWDELALVHTREYLTKIRDGTLTPDDIAQLELPWSPEMVEGFRVMVGGTIEAARLALEHGGIVGHIGGGLHHAFPNHGEGFCPFNDVAVAIRVLQRDGVQRTAVIDLDVHHGNGTAFIFESDSNVFTFSMHQQYNYPMWKPRGSLDIGLMDGIGDADYHRQLEEALPAVMASNPECLFYLAGADPYEQDQLGGLSLTLDGLRARDRIVIDQARRNRLPMVIVLAGGYARRVEDTVAVHTATLKEAAR